MSCFVSKNVDYWVLNSALYEISTSFFFVSCVRVCSGCMWGERHVYACMYVCMCVAACEGLRLTSAVFLVCVPTYSSKKSLSINPGLAPSPQPPGIYTDDGGLNSNPHAYTASTLSTELSLQSHFTIHFTLMGKSTNLSSYLLFQ